MRFFSLIFAAVGLTSPAAPIPVRLDPLTTAPPPAYRAVVERVIDAATIEVRVLLSRDREITPPVHLRHVTAPNRNAPCPAERAAAEEASTP